MEHLPRSVARYAVTPVCYDEARTWLAQPGISSLIRTTEVIGAIGAGLGITLEQTDAPMTIQAGDEVLLISLSFSVLLAWAEGGIIPLEDDWRCLFLKVEAGLPESLPVAAASQDRPDDPSAVA